MTDRAIITLFFSMCLGATVGTIISRDFADPAAEVQVYSGTPPSSSEPEDGIKMYSEVIELRCI